MDTDVDVILNTSSDRAPLPPVAALFENQEERFSRFRTTSALSALNRGEPVRDSVVATVCRLAAEAHAFTGGLYNPMVLPALREAGYGATFQEARGGAPRRQPVPSPTACLAIEGEAVRLLAGQLDLGGIVKGWTVDQAVDRLGGAFHGLLVNAGGDLRVAGDEDAPGAAWNLAVGLPGRLDDAWSGRVDAALATSTTLKRSWRTSDGRRAHHLIDPRTGLPADSPFVQVSVWAPECWRAEVWAKAVLIGGPEAGERCAASGLRALAITHAGDLHWFEKP